MHLSKFVAGVDALKVKSSNENSCKKRDFMRLSVWLRNKETAKSKRINDKDMRAALSVGAT